MRSRALAPDERDRHAERVYLPLGLIAAAAVVAAQSRRAPPGTHSHN